jgi:hypothetical protein
VGAAAAAGRTRKASPPREIRWEQPEPREEFNVPFFADPEEEMGVLNDPKKTEIDAGMAGAGENPCEPGSARMGTVAVRRELSSILTAARTQSTSFTSIAPSRLSNQTGKPSAQRATAPCPQPRA